MPTWSLANRPARHIRDDELLSMLLALARANGGATAGYIAALIDVATAYGVEAELRRRVAALGCGGRVIEGGQRMA